MGIFINVGCVIDIAIGVVSRTTPNREIRNSIHRPPASGNPSDCASPLHLFGIPIFEMLVDYSGVFYVTFLQMIDHSMFFFGGVVDS